MIKSLPKALSAMIAMGVLALVSAPASAQGCRDRGYYTSYGDDYGRSCRRVVYHTSYRNCGYHRARRVVYVSDPYDDYGYRRSCRRRSHSGFHVSYRSGGRSCYRHRSGGVQVGFYIGGRF